MPTQVMTLSEAYETLHLDPKTTKVETVLSVFGTEVSLTKKGETDKREKIIQAKFTINRHLISERVKEKRFFEITSPFTNTCNNCNGLGEFLRFFKKTVLVNCHICGGKGSVKDKCPSCKGSGRYIRDFKGVGLNLKCKVCNGTGKAKTSCQNCMGEGKIKKPVLDHKIKSTTSCHTCKEIGFIPVRSGKKKKREKTTPPLTHSIKDKMSAKQMKTLSQMIQDGHGE